MSRREVASRIDQERRCPDPCPHPRIPDPFRRAPQRPETALDVEPVADPLFVAVVDLDDLHRQVEPARRLHVLGHVILADPLEVAGPGTPAGRYVRDTGRAQAIADRGERAVEVGRLQRIDRPVGRHMGAVALGCDAKRRHLAARLRGEPRARRAFARSDDEQAFGLDDTAGHRFAWSPGHRLHPLVGCGL